MNVETNFLKLLILKLFIPKIRREIPQSLHVCNIYLSTYLPIYLSNHLIYIIINNSFFVKKTYILLFRNNQSLREALNIHNTYRGYVFVIDADCKIRWFAHGYATPKEIETMSKIIKNLNER